MTKCSVFIATSLDGYIARSDGNIDWLDQANAVVPKGEDCGYSDFMSTVDALVMGRNTFEQVSAFPVWPYGKTPVVVLSRTINKLPATSPATVFLSSDSPSQLVKQLSAKGLEHLYVDGGLTIQSFLQAGLIDEMIITIIPVLLGEGLPLFRKLDHDVQLECMSSKYYEFGFLQCKYRVHK